MVARGLLALALGGSLTLAGATSATGEDPPADGQVLQRVSGEAEVESQPQSDGSTFYRSGTQRVTTPLPEGYPRPTPPGVVELKRYPEVRRATFEGEGAGPNGMENSRQAFWPLFQHIKSRDIAMTAPVEIEYQEIQAGKENEGTQTKDWSMSFLYRSKENGPTESHDRITVADTQPITVISTGITGDATREQIERALKTLNQALADLDDWRTTDEVRVLGYNGPDVPQGERWSEVQIKLTTAGEG